MYRAYCTMPLFLLQLVVANLLKTRRTEVLLVSSQGDDVGICKLSTSSSQFLDTDAAWFRQEVEELIVHEIAQQHFAFYS